MGQLVGVPLLKHGLSPAALSVFSVKYVRSERNVVLLSSGLWPNKEKRHAPRSRLDKRFFTNLCSTMPLTYCFADTQSDPIVSPELKLCCVGDEILTDKRT